MKILLLSDTHGYIDDKITNHAKQADEIWHAGDIGTIEVIETLSNIKPVKAVYGNIDGKEIRQLFHQDIHFEVAGLTIYMTHIGGYPNHYEPRVRAIFSNKKIDLFICGHSHILRVMRDASYGNMLVMNPGAAGIQGFHTMRTMLRFSIQNGILSQVEAIELGKRGSIK